MILSNANIAWKTKILCTTKCQLKNISQLFCYLNICSIQLVLLLMMLAKASTRNTEQTARLWSAWLVSGA